MSKYKVIVSEKATRMMIEHALFLDNVSPKAADRFVDQFEEAVLSLEDNPERYPWVDEDYIPRYKYRRMLFQKQYMVFYQLREKEVLIDYVLDTRQNLKALFT